MQLCMSVHVRARGEYICPVKTKQYDDRRTCRRKSTRTHKPIGKQREPGGVYAITLAHAACLIEFAGGDKKKIVTCI